MPVSARLRWLAIVLLLGIGSCRRSDEPATQEPASGKATTDEASVPTVAKLADSAPTNELDRRRLTGKAFYENDQFVEAVEEYSKALDLDPDSAADHFNVALILSRKTDYSEALAALERAQALDPDLLAVHYLRGIVRKRLSEFEEGIKDLDYVSQRDPQCLGAFYNLGICYKNLQRNEEAIRSFERAVEIDASHASAHYQLMALYRRVGDVDNSNRHREVFVNVKDLQDESEKTVEALERSRYSHIVEAPLLLPDLEPASFDRVRLVDVTAAAGLAVDPAVPSTPMSLPQPIERATYDVAEMRRRLVPQMGSAVALGDYDGDGDLDVYVVRCGAAPDESANRLYANDGDGHFTDVSERAQVGNNRCGLDAVFGDYDNDGHLDLYVGNDGPNSLFHNSGDGTFEDVSHAAGVDEPGFGRVVLTFDYDHDNDLDLLVGNQFVIADPPDVERFTFPHDLAGGCNTLLRNNGNGTFTDQTDEAGLLTDCSQTHDMLFADFDGDYDTDLLVANGAATPLQVFANARMGRFAPPDSSVVSSLLDVTAMAECDFTHNGNPDLVVASGRRFLLLTNDRSGLFASTPIELPKHMASSRVDQLRVADLNNDGWSDVLLAASGDRLLGVLAGDGPGRFRDRSNEVGLDTLSIDVAGLSVGDLDGDGDLDILVQTRDRGPVFLRNESPEAPNWLGVRLVGKKVNKCGYGASVEIASGGHYQRQTVRDGVVHFGMSTLDEVDVVRIIWPNGVAQNVVRPAINGVLTVEEHVKVSASCGFLYAYNGTGFELVNEILGIGPLGVPMGPEKYHQPDCTELTKIEAHQLRPRDGHYELRLTEELRETMYLDQMRLRVVDHPAELEVIPNEKFKAPPFPEDKFFAVADHLSPVLATDDRNGDVLDLVTRRDGRYPTFPLTRYDGLAEGHSLTLDFGDLSGREQVLLFLDGWIYWSDSSTVMAIAQDPRFAFRPLALEVCDEKGQWHTAIESVGLPTSKGLVVPVDVTGRFLCDDHRIRLSTNMCVYFDRVFISSADEAERCRVTELGVTTAELHYRGFSAMIQGANGYEDFDYGRVSEIGSWSPPRGLLTRYGGVAPLLDEPDNQYIIFGPGDELSMRFSADSLPTLPDAWTRDFILYANGWVKDGDLNTKYSDAIEPLPFHGMSAYPYAGTEAYPQTPGLDRYRRTYNTRESRQRVGRLPLTKPAE